MNDNGVVMKPSNLKQLQESGWRSKSVKQEIYDNFVRQLSANDSLFPGIIGYDDTVIPELCLALLAGHDVLFLGEKGQGKSRLMRHLAQFLDPEIPYLDIPSAPFHEDPFRPLSQVARQFCATTMPRTCPSPGGRGSIATVNVCARHKVR